VFPFLDPQDEVGSSLFLGRPMFLRPFGLYCSDCFEFYLYPSSVRVVATFPGTVLFPLLCSVLPPPP
jgi:hypothetical protein